MVHDSLVLVLTEADFYSQFRDPLDYDRKSLALLLQLVVASYASFLPFTPSKEQLPEKFPQGEKYH